MKLIRWPLGLVFILLGMVGLLTSIVATAGIWFGLPTIQVAALEAVEPIENGLATGKTYFSDTGDALTSTRAQIAEMRKTADAIAALDDETLNGQLAQLELDHKRLDTHLANASALVQFSRSAVETMTKLASQVKNVPNLNVDTYSAEGPISRSIRNASDGLTELDSLLTSAREIITKIDSNGTLNRQHLSELPKLLVASDEKLAQVQAAVSDFATQLAKGELGIQDFKSELPTIFTTVAIALTIILAWLAISQYALMTFGKSLMRA